MLTIASLSLEEAQQLVVLAIEECERVGVAQNIALVDAVGDLLAFARMDGANRLSSQIAINKAVTSAATGLETGDIAPRTVPGEPGYMIQTQCGGTFTTIGGGVPLKTDGEVVGALGISGGSVAQDSEIADAVRARFRI